MPYIASKRYVLRNVILSFPRLVEMEEKVMPNGESYKSFRCQLVAPMDHKGMNEVVNWFLEEMAKTRTKGEIIKIKNNPNKRCWKNGNDQIDADGVVRPMYKDTIYLQASNKQHIQMIDKNDKGYFYGNENYKELALDCTFGSRVDVALDLNILDYEGLQNRAKLLAVKLISKVDVMYEPVDVSSLFTSIGQEETNGNKDDKPAVRAITEDNAGPDNFLS